MVKIHSEITNKDYYSEAAKVADEQGFKEVQRAALKEKAEADKKAQQAKEDRATKAKVLEEEINKFYENETKIQQQYAELRKSRDAEIKTVNDKFLEEAKKLNTEMNDNQKKINELITAFLKEYPNGFHYTIRNGNNLDPVFSQMFRNFWNLF